MSFSGPSDPALKVDEERSASFLENITSLSTATNAIQGPARNIDSSNTDPIAQVNSGLKSMTRATNRALRKVQSEKGEKFREKEAQLAILSAYKDFIAVHTETLGVLTSKLPIIAKVPSGKPGIRAGLAELGAAIDMYAQGLATLVPDVSSDLTSEQKRFTAQTRATVLRFA